MATQAKLKTEQPFDTRVSPLPTLDPFEPKAQSLLNAIGNGTAPKGMTCNDAYAVSIAVSLKRIADALYGTEGTAGVLQLLNPLDVRNNY